MLPYDLDVQRLKLAMEVGGEYRLHLIGVREWRKLAAAVKVNDEQLVERVADQAMRLPDAFAEACKNEAVAALDSPLPSRLLVRVGSRADLRRRWLGN